MDIEMQDRIDSYIRDEMTAQERSKFTSELSSNAELRKEFEFTRSVAKCISDREKKKQLIKEWQKNDSSHRTIYISSAITSIAAMLVVGFFLFKPIPDSSSQLAMNTASSTQKYVSLTEISLMISNKDYDTALKFIEKAEYSATSVNTTSQSTTIESRDSIRTDLYELRWLKAQALVGLKRIDEAKLELSQIKGVEGKYQAGIDSLWNELQYIK